MKILCFLGLLWGAKISHAQYEGAYCVTPNNEVAFCISLHECPVLVEGLRNQHDQLQQFFLKNSVCGYKSPYWGSIPLVCCGSRNNYERVYVTQGQPGQWQPAQGQPGQGQWQPGQGSQGKPGQPDLGQSGNGTQGQGQSDWGELELQDEDQPGQPAQWEPQGSYNGKVEAPKRPTTPKPTTTTDKYTLLPPLGECGASEDADRILGGTEATIGEFPWMTQLYYRSPTNVVIPFYNFCGGSLISKRYVLTAAHCIVGEIQSQGLTIHGVRLGEHDITKEIDCYEEQGCNEKVVDVLVVEAIAHHGFLAKGNEIDRHDDIALLRLAIEVTYTAFIVPICLPTNGESAKPKDLVYTAGWGAIDKEATTSSDVKMKINFTIVPMDVCARNYNRNYKIKLASTQVCAGGESGKDSCNGDSGGPLMKLIPKSYLWYLEGIVSFGPKVCGTAGTPGVYTKVATYLDWIVANMRP